MPPPRAPSFLSTSANAAPRPLTLQAAPGGPTATGTPVASPLAARQAPVRAPSFLAPPTPLPVPEVETVRKAPTKPATNVPRISSAELDAARAEASLAARAAQERVAEAVLALQARGERLADDVRTEALEIAFLIARRVLEAELSQGPEAFTALVRSAVRRVGEANRVQVRVCPLDMGALHSQIGERALRGVSAAKIEVVPDPSLEPGDCVVESERASVDGRLASRLVELRRALDPMLAEDVA